MRANNRTLRETANHRRYREHTTNAAWKTCWLALFAFALVLPMASADSPPLPDGFVDFFSPISWPDSTFVAPSQRAHRLLLRTLMVKHGFNPYAQEWWHFTLAVEPYPATYFDFPVE